jgi:hypothetical protein
MSFFGKILEKLGMRKPEASSQRPQETKRRSPTPDRTSSEHQPTAGKGQPPGAPSPAQRPAAEPGAQASTARPTPVAMVDVVSHLEALAAKNPQKLNWRTSIVDLLKLLDIDSSLDARKKLAAELGAPAAVMDESAKMNIWLHRTVLQQIAENGGNVPKELLD